MKILIFVFSGLCMAALAVFVSVQTGDNVAVGVVLAAAAFVQLFAALAIDLI